MLDLFQPLTYLGTTAIHVLMPVYPLYLLTLVFPLCTCWYETIYLWLGLIFLQLPWRMLVGACSS